MKNKKNIILIIIIICLNLTVHCTPLNNSFLTEKYILYEKSRKELREKNFDNAIYILEKIKKNNKADFINDKIQINLIYAYYKNLDLIMAQKNIKEFISCYPNHPNIDYVIYMQCLVNMTLDKKIFFNIIPADYHKSDPYYAKKSFFYLKNFIVRYPKSLYVANAKKNLIYLKNRLSEYDFNILKFYFSNKEYVAVINRGEEIIQKYSDTIVARKALVYIKKSYNALKIFDTAEIISKIISLNKI